jgi:urease accessory protein
MNAPSATLRLLAWLSPAFPVGGFSYSHGLERAVHDGLVSDRETLAEWIVALIEVGSGWNDAVLFAEAHRRAGDTEIAPTVVGTDTPSRPPADLIDLAHLAEALAGSEERHRETMLQGSAFVAAASGWPHPVLRDLPDPCPYCLAVGAVAGAHDLPLETALMAYLQAFASNLIQAGIRLGVTGQTGAVQTLSALEPVLIATASRAVISSLDDLGSAALFSDIAAMRHETQQTRLFRS